MYALVSFFGVATVGGFGAGQTHPVYGAATATTKKTDKDARLRGAGVVRHWLDGSRPSGTPQGHARMVG